MTTNDEYEDLYREIDAMATEQEQELEAVVNQILEQLGRVKRITWQPWHFVQLLERDGLVCGICKKPLQTDNIATEKIDVDHIAPNSKAGGNEIDNLRLTHASCNRSRGNKISIEDLLSYLKRKYG